MNTQMLHHHRMSSAYSYFTAGCLTPEHPLTNKIRSEATILLISGGEKGDGGHMSFHAKKQLQSPLKARKSYSSRQTLASVSKANGQRNIFHATSTSRIRL